jgi:hypothetical protein
MSTQLTNGSVVFGDSTTLSTNTVAQSSITGVPTLLSQFTNDLGNYGGWLTASNIDTTTVAYWNSSSPSDAQILVGWNGSTLYPYSPNCNCQCNC